MEKQITVPEFKTLEEMAEFWDNHDLTDFENEMEEVNYQIFAQPISCILRTWETEPESF